MSLHTPAPNTVHILVVDDELGSREVACIALQEAGYQVTSAMDGDEAIALFEAQPERFHVVILDRMMPRLDGLTTLQRLRPHPASRHVQFIFATALASEAHIAEGLAAGAYYYLTKPFHIDQLCEIVRTAVRDIAPLRRDLLPLSTYGTAAPPTDDYHFRTLHEARTLAAFLIQHYHCEDGALLGVMELFVNALEHGMLGITYDEKTWLNLTQRWEEEVEARQHHPDYAHARVSVQVSVGSDTVTFDIIDPGTGFDWHNYLSIAPERAFDNHGRGIALARELSLLSLSYHGRGNHVTAVARKKPAIMPDGQAAVDALMI